MDNWRKCRECGIMFPRSAISKRGFCGLCGMKRQLDSCRQIRERKGPSYDRYKASVERAKKRREAAKLAAELVVPGCANALKVKR